MVISIYHAQFNLRDNPAFSPRCAKTLEAEIKKIDAQYDLCNEAWAKGEQEKFWGDELLDKNIVYNHLQQSYTIIKVPPPFDNPLYMKYINCFPRSIMSLHVETERMHACPHHFKSYLKFLALQRFFKLAEKRMKDATFVFKS